jgi:hypothetical protein
MGHMTMLSGLPDGATIKIQGQTIEDIGRLCLYSHQGKVRLSVVCGGIKTVINGDYVVGNALLLSMEGFTCWGNGDFQPTLIGIGEYNSAPLKYEYSFEFR